MTLLILGLLACTDGETNPDDTQVAGDADTDAHPALLRFALCLELLSSHDPGRGALEARIVETETQPRIRRRIPMRFRVS